MIILLDLDSTLVAQEGCNTLAHWKGVGDEVVNITQRTMNGEIDFNTAFPKKLELIQPSHHDLDRIGEFLLDYVSDAWKEVIASRQEAGIQVGILSQGYTRSSLKIAEAVGIDPDRVFALHFNHNEDGSFHSLDMSQDLMYFDGKQKIIEEIQEQYPDQSLVLVGDSVGDMRSGAAADLFVAYAGVVARDAVLAKAEHIAYTPYELVSIVDKVFALSPICK